MCEPACQRVCVSTIQCNQWLGWLVEHNTYLVICIVGLSIIIFFTCVCPNHRSFLLILISPISIQFHSYTIPVYIFFIQYVNQKTHAHTHTVAHSTAVEEAQIMIKSKFNVLVKKFQWAVAASFVVVFYFFFSFSVVAHNVFKGVHRYLYILLYHIRSSIPMDAYHLWEQCK